jgi:polyisoprenoid-binding protein YceI
MLRVLNRSLAIAAVLAVGGCSVLLAKIVPSHNQTVDTSAIPSGRYMLDPTHASLHFKVSHMGYSTYVARFNDIEATFLFDSAAPEKSALDVTIAANSVDTGYGRMDEVLNSAKFMHSQRFPEILFAASGITLIDDKNGVIDGALTFHGVTRQVPLYVTFNGGAKNQLNGKYTLGFSATATFQRSNFNMNAYIPLVGDEVTIEIEAEFRKKE